MDMVAIQLHKATHCHTGAQCGVCYRESDINITVQNEIE